MEPGTVLSHGGFMNKLFPATTCHTALASRGVEIANFTGDSRVPCMAGSALVLVRGRRTPPATRLLPSVSSGATLTTCKYINNTGDLQFNFKRPCPALDTLFPYEYDDDDDCSSRHATRLLLSAGCHLVELDHTVNTKRHP